MKPQIPDAGVNNGKAGLSRSSGIFAGSGLFSLSGGAIDLLAEMGKSVLSVVPGLSPVYNRLGNPGGAASLPRRWQRSRLRRWIFVS